MRILRVLAALYFAVALYGVLHNDSLHWLTMTYKVALLCGVIILLLAWEYIFSGALDGSADKSKSTGD